MPTSVLLAVLAAAGLLALAPALVRRYDATERLVAERATSTARVLAAPPSAPHRARTPTGQPPAATGHVAALRVTAAGRRPPPVPAPPPGRLRAGPGAPHGPPPPAARRRHTPAVYRRRRVFAALVLLNVVELVGVLLVGPGFWIGFAVTGTLLGVYLVHLRNRALADRRRRRDRGPRGGLAGRPAGRGAPRAGPPGGGPPRGASAGCRPAGPSAERRWAWTATRRTCRPRSTAGRCPTGGAAGCAAGPTRPAGADLRTRRERCAGRVVRGAGWATC